MVPRCPDLWAAALFKSLTFVSITNYLLDQAIAFDLKLRSVNPRKILKRLAFYVSHLEAFPKQFP